MDKRSNNKRAAKTDLKMTRPLTATAAGELAGVSAQTIKRWAHAGQFRARILPGGHWRVDRESFERFLADCEVRPERKVPREPELKVEFVRRK